MAEIRVTCWREIPVLVTAREGTDEVTAPLSQRFQELVDVVAVQAGLADADAYLAEWRVEAAPDHPGSAAEAAAAVAAGLEARFGEIRARSLKT